MGKEYYIKFVERMFQQMLLGQLDMQKQKNKTELPHTIYKSLLKMDHRSKHKGKTIKF